MTYANASIEIYLSDCKEKFDQTLSDVLAERNQDAHEVEASICIFRFNPGTHSNRTRTAPLGCLDYQI